jgi:hypothetical protein
MRTVARNASLTVLSFCFCIFSTAIAQAPARPVFVIHSAAGNPVKGAIKSIDEKWNVTLDGTPGAKVNGADLLSIRRAELPLPGPPTTSSHVIFANGDRLPGTFGDLTGEKLTFRTPLGKPEAITLPLSALAVLWFDTPAGMDRPDLVRRRLLLEKRTTDIVWLRNGDQLHGNVIALSRDALQIEVDRKELKLDRNKIAVIALNNELVHTLRPKEPYAQLVLADGCRLSLASLRADAVMLTGKTLFGATVQIPLSEVRAIDIRQGRAVYLSELKPASYQYTPYLPRLSYPWIADGSIGDGSPVGDDMRLAGSTYVKGLGMHSASRISYPLDGQYRRFEAIVGLDDHGGRNGSVRLRILVDGKERDWGWDKELTARDGPKTVRLDVAGARELTLVVEYGRFDQGQVNWADARLVK